MNTRYAIYFAPAPGTLFHTLGSRWIGRDAASGETFAQPDIAGIGVVTGDPRRYGFHATLKPPFALRNGVTPDTLMRAAAALASHQKEIRVTLEVAVIDRFLALVPREPSPALNQLAERAVRDLDGFRRPASAGELARRRASGLSARQEEHLATWGYPYVFEEFRFHMTLTERLPPAYADRFAAAAEEHFAPVLAGPVAIDGITVFEEAANGAPFLATRHFSFPASADGVAA